MDTGLPRIAALFAAQARARKTCRIGKERIRTSMLSRGEPRDMRITECKTNGITNPIGYSFPRVAFSFEVTDTDSEDSALYTIEVSKEEQFQTIIASKTGTRVNCAQEVVDLSLEPRTRYYWRVSVQGTKGDEAVSETAYFETGKLDEQWQADWIGTEREDRFHPIFFRKFTAGKEITSARLYICGLGLYEAYLNGKRVGRDYLTPGLHDYTSEYQYQTYDVTEQIDRENEIQVMLGKGWYMGRYGLEGREHLYGDRFLLIAELHLRYADGRETVLGTDESWLYKGSDIKDSGIYDGEIYDHCLWNERPRPQKKAVVLQERKDRLTENWGVPVRVKAELPVTRVIHTPAGETVLDFGQNFAGYVEFYADLPEGTVVTLDFGEVLQNGNFYNENYRSARSRFTYISGGIAEKVWPHFTFFGFRYVRVSGWAGEPDASLFTGKAVYSDLERTGWFECSDTRINRVYENSYWSQCSNFIDVPTDCPQRDERMAWTGDAQVFAPTASYHMDTRVFYRKFLHDLRMEQKKLKGGIPNYFPDQGNLSGCSAIWGDIATFLPDVLREHYGNTAEYEDEYEMMRDWVDYVTREMADSQHLVRGNMQFGDWLALDGVTEQSKKGGTDDDYVASIYYYASAQKTAEMARRLGREEEKDYRELAGEIRQALLHEYFSGSGRLCVDTQTGYLLALRFGVYRERQVILDGLMNRFRLDGYQLRCGFAGAPVLCQVLASQGLPELAYHFLLNEDFPGWLHCVKLGATTIWERWNSLDEHGMISGTGMNSLNHYAYGSVAEFLYAYVAGIRSGDDGFREAVIAPQITGRFRYVRCTYRSAWGRYRCDWEIKENGSVKVRIEIPFGCGASVRLPRCRQGELCLASGQYDFCYEPDRDFRCIYDENSFLRDLASDAKTAEILKEDLPLALSLGNGDKEEQTLTLGLLKDMFYLGVDPAAVERTIGKIRKVIA